MRIHHIALRTRDLARLEGFYAGVLGLPVARRDEGRSVWLEAGGAIVMIERASDDEPDVDPRGREVLAFGGTADEVCALEARLVAAGVSGDGATDFTVYARDPDGRRVAVSSYPAPRTRSDPRTTP